MENMESYLRALLIFISQLTFCGTSAPETLQLVQIVYRHGDRSPINPFPTDVNNGYWIDGWGRLTNLGKQQQFELGQYTRQRYSGFLSDRYDQNEFFIRSTDVDRTLMSAYCNLAGLYPPMGDQIWDEDIAWQPIPVHTRPTGIDYIVDPDPDCPKDAWIFDNVKQYNPALQQINAENADLFEYLTNVTGTYVKDLFSINDIFDTLLCDKNHNLTLPSWADPVWDQMEYLFNIRFYFQYGLPELSRLSGGPLVGHMIENMRSKIEGASEAQKMYMFSSHDSKVMAFLASLDVWNVICPPLASSVFVELHKLTDDQYSVEIYYRNDTTVDPYVLSIPGCGSPCLMDTFVALTQGQIPEDIAKECYLIEDPHKQTQPSESYVN